MAKKKDACEALAEAIVSEIDYDLWKSLYHKDCIEDPDEAKATRKRLRDIVQEHVVRMRAPKTSRAPTRAAGRTRHR